MKEYLIIAIVGILLFAMNANAAFPVDEAGIAAYVRVGQNVELTKTFGAYEEIVNINKQDIIGKVRISNKHNDSIPLVYVGADGWIVAYYPKSEPASRIMQWNGYTKPFIVTTTLADAISKMATALGVNYESIKANITYYDFRYPEANEMMMIVEDNSVTSSNSFSLLIPDTIKLYDASYSYFHGQGYGYLMIDSTYIHQFGCDPNRYMIYEFYNPTLFETNIMHNIQIYGVGCYSGPWWHSNFGEFASTVLIYKYL